MYLYLQQRITAVTLQACAGKCSSSKARTAWTVTRSLRLCCAAKLHECMLMLMKHAMRHENTDNCCGLSRADERDAASNTRSAAGDARAPGGHGAVPSTTAAAAATELKKEICLVRGD